MSQSEVKKTLHELKVNELRNVLEKRGMDKTGIKAILIDRLDQDIWSERADRMADTSALYNTSDIGERKWLLDLLMEESDPDSGGEEHITEQDLKEIVKIFKDTVITKCCFKTPNDTCDLTNSQYTYYGAGLISAFDRFSENQKNVRKEFEIWNMRNKQLNCQRIFQAFEMESFERENRNMDLKGA
ncbi:hypothetical protein niasHT_029516 [Heterodera trifolii]|uniref:SAP domain-containing protein n=1 Tax=Heterodera trifolii TaxID=157864 RepID=A0ABD2JB00_9BILA